MVQLDSSLPLKYTKDGFHFEILVDPHLAKRFQSGTLSDLDEVLVVEEVFTDAKKGIRSSERDLERCFGHHDRRRICEQILMKSDIPLTVEEQRHALEERRKQLIHLVHRNVINPSTGSPHPPQRIENAFEEAKIRVNVSQSAEAQLDDVVRALRSLLPLRYEVRVLSLFIPASFAGKSAALLRKYGKILKESWQGSDQYVELEIPAGVQEALEVDLNTLTKGHIRVEVKEKR